MISYGVYKVIHVLGVMLLFLALGGFAVGGSALTKGSSWRRSAAITHGVGILFLLVAGFGLLARLGFGNTGLPNWVLVKLGIWVLLGVAMVVALRKPQWSKALWWATPLLGALAAFMAIQKPF